MARLLLLLLAAVVQASMLLLPLQPMEWMKQQVTLQRH
jgi:hypothetical protein